MSNTTISPHLSIQGPDDGSPGEPPMKFGPSLVTCLACDWAQWSPKEGEQPGGRHAAGLAHLDEAHPAAVCADHLDSPPPADLLRPIAEAAEPGCCHTTGTHDPRHFVDGKYLCDQQKAEAWHRVVLLLGIGRLAHPEAAERRPDSCFWCAREAEMAAVPA